ICEDRKIWATGRRRSVYVPTSRSSMDQPIQVEGLMAGAAALSAAEEPVSYVDLGAFSQDLLHGILGLHAEHGPIAAIQDGQLRVVFIFSPELNQQVLSDTTRYHARFFAVRGPKNS